ncbi:MAG: HNH endonuclease [Phycisphaeraceae bacterium]|nr:HNH endonuclease [Phycisphaeraceae bacterium]
MDFATRYGAIAADFIHVHHIGPIATQKEAHMVDAVRDLRPVCPNCHAVLHRVDPPMHPDELRDRLSHHEHRPVTSTL